MDAIAEANEWLNNTSDYDKGLQILKALGADSFTLMLLFSGADNFNREKLYSEISQKIVLQDISERIISRPEVNFNTHILHKLPKEEIDASEESNIKLVDDLSIDLSLLMDERAERKANLRFLYQDNSKMPERRKIAFDILDIVDKINRIQSDKDFFLQYGYLPSGLPEPEDDPLTLKRRQSTVRTYIVRYEKHKENPDKLKQYQEELAVIDAKLSKYAI